MKFKEYRLMSEKSQSEVGAVIGLKRRAYAKRENDPGLFTIMDVMKLADYYGVEPEELLGIR